ncbi:MAG: hypothetical protein EPO20_30590 [Betaproteobacteria bacterium]|nr:MAG: hypothetical protein EPO20_30590 [Betaproteobacteria bacterium]
MKKILFLIAASVLLFGCTMPEIDNPFDEQPAPEAKTYESVFSFKTTKDCGKVLFIEKTESSENIASLSQTDNCQKLPEKPEDSNSYVVNEYCFYPDYKIQFDENFHYLGYAWNAFVIDAGNKREIFSFDENSTYVPTTIKTFECGA